MSENRHLSDEKIMSFVSMTYDDMTPETTQECFAAVAHFAQCERCRKIKDSMMSFSEKFDSFLLEASWHSVLKMKIYQSLDKLDILDEFDDCVLMSVRAKISKEAGKSLIKKDSDEYTYIKNLPSNTDKNENYTAVSDLKNNRIMLNEEIVCVHLCDDGKDKHSVLMIPDKEENLPVFCRMQHADNSWQLQCACPDEDDYDIVVF